MKKYIFSAKKFFFINLFGNLVLAILFIILAKLIQIIIDASLEKNVTILINCILSTILFVLFISLSRYITRISNAKYLTACIKKLENDYLRAILEKDYQIMSKENSAKYLSIFENDIKPLEAKYFDIFPRVIANIFLIFFAFFGIAFYNFNLSIFTILAYSPLILVPILTGSKNEKVNKDYVIAQQNLLLKIKDILLGFEVIKGFNSEKIVYEKVAKTIDNVQDINYKIKKISVYIVTSTNFFGYLAQISFYLFGGYLVLNESITIGALMGCIQLSNQFVSPILSIVEDITTLRSVKLINERIINVIDKKNTTQLKAEKPLIGEIRNIKLENLYFSYETTPILNNISYVFEKGKKYAIIGNSGSGKTTLVKIIQGYYKNYKGNVLINDISLHELSEKQILNKISCISQNAFIFEESIYNNITMFTHPNETHLNKILQETGIKKMLLDMDSNLDTLVLENGKNISGGQKQRISIARALLCNTQVLILDEATSNLDISSSIEIEKLVLSLENTTVINVTHKLIPDVLADYDEILVLSNGNIIETGNCEELIAKRGYLYKMILMNELTQS